MLLLTTTVPVCHYKLSVFPMTRYVLKLTKKLEKEYLCILRGEKQVQHQNRVDYSEQ